MIGRVILFSLLALVAAVILAVILVLLFLRVGLRFEQKKEELTVRIQVGSKILPPNPERLRKAKETLDEWKETQPDGDLALLRDFLPTILRTVGKLCGKLRVDKLDLLVTVGAENPCDAAIEYGRASALLGTFWTLAVNLFRVVDGRARAEVDFEQKKTSFYLLTDLTVSAGQLLVIAIVFVVKIFKIQFRRIKRNNELEERRVNNGNKPSH